MEDDKGFQYYLEKIKNRLRVHAEPIYNYIEDVINNTKTVLWFFKWLFIFLSSAILLWLFLIWVTSLAADKYNDSDNGWWLTMPFIALIMLIILIPRRLS